MTIPSELKKLADNFFADRSDEFDLSTNEGCGKYTEAFVRFAQISGYPKVGHLRKTGGQTQYNGHANDAFLYKEVNEDGLMRAVDIIGNAEAKPPYTPSNQPPKSFFGIDEPRYKVSDWMAEPADLGDGDTGGSPSVKFPGYESLGGDGLIRKELGRAYAYDAQRAGQTKINAGTVIWPWRVAYDSFFEIVVHGKDATSSVKEIVEKQRKDWCRSMGINVVPVPVDFEP